jgi:hypothetical protein
MRSPACNRRKLRHREVGWEATGGEPSVRRMTNAIRPGVAASLRFNGEARTHTKVGEAQDAEG